MTQKKYNYELMKGSKKFICPSCKKKRFTPYVKTDTNIIVDAEKYGYCDRRVNCQYHQYPQLEAWEKDDLNNWTPPPPQPPKPLDYVPKDLVSATFNQYKTNVFYMWLVKLFGIDKADSLRTDYNIGTAKGNGTIFFQEDRKGNVRTGKVMYYHPNGKRIKERNSWFLHSRIKDDFNYRQCFFGLHLVDGEKPVALAESEKTAVVMSVFMPEYTWIASGGSEMLNTERLLELPRLDKVFADSGQFEKWKRKTRIFEPEMDISVDEAVNNGILKEGDDILDLYLAREKKNELNLAM